MGLNEVLADAMKNGRTVTLKPSDISDAEGGSGLAHVLSALMKAAHGSSVAAQAKILPTYVFASKDGTIEAVADMGSGSIAEISDSDRLALELKLRHSVRNIGTGNKPRPGEWFTTDLSRYKYPDIGKYALCVDNLPVDLSLDENRRKKAISVENCLIAVQPRSCDHVRFVTVNDALFRAVPREEAIGELSKSIETSRALIRFAEDSEAAFKSVNDLNVGQLVRPRHGTLMSKNHSVGIVLNAYEHEKNGPRRCVGHNFGKDVLVRFTRKEGGFADMSLGHQLLCPLVNVATEEQLNGYAMMQDSGKPEGEGEGEHGACCTPASLANEDKPIDLTTAGDEDKDEEM